MNQPLITLLEENYTRISNFLGYEVEAAICIPLAVQYTLAGKYFNGLEFEQLKRHLARPQKQSLLQWLTDFSRSQALHYKLVTYFVLHTNREEEYVRVVKGERLLEEAGFNRSHYQSIAALFLLDDKHAKRAKLLHEEMKRHHYFLTGKDDIPYAVLLTRKEGNITKQAETIRHYYDVLQENGFKKGDSLQAMTQLLTLYSEDVEETLMEYVQAICTMLEENGIDVKKRHYPYIALLALTGTTTVQLQEMIALTKQLQQLNLFEAEPVYALLIAIYYLIYQMQDTKQLVHLTDVSLLLDALTVSDLLWDFTFFFGFDILDLLT
ncbi:MAG: DUF4003 family protein [Solibacillus sp.]